MVKKKAKQSQPYVCMPHYCSCPQFFNNLPKHGPAPALCKHMLAVKLATAAGQVEEKEVEDADFWYHSCPAERPAPAAPAYY